MALITHQGISDAIANLQPNPVTLKGRLVSLIHSYFPTDERLEEIDSIPAEELIKQLWEIDDPAGIRQKKKNLSSLKSSINKDLKNLARQGKNPEGLIINRDNVFTISDEHKDDLLQKLGLSGALDPKDILTLMRGILDSAMQGDGQKETATSLLKELDKTREMIAKAAGLGDAAQPKSAPGTGITDAAAGRSLDGAAITGTIPGEDERQTATTGGKAEEEPAGPTMDMGAGGADGAEDKSAGEELLDDDEFKLLDETEILEQEAEIAVDAPGAADAALAEGELSEQGTGEGTQGDGGAEAGPATEELLDEKEFDILDEAEILEQETDIVDDVPGVADTGMAEGELSEQGTGEGTQGDGGAEAGPATEELLNEEEFELLDETEILEQEAEIAVDAPGTVDAALAEGELSEQGTGEGTQGDGGAEAGPATEELLNE
ncbi:MAG: hypothetical protein KJ862_00620, partial [Proteobacteria bacterium]|nr:hypothetical protein [Pseudomonadota bacterium]